MPHYKAFIKSLKIKKEDIFHPDDVPKKLMGPIHALALQLLAKGIIELKVSDQIKVGTDNLNDTHIIVDLANACDSEGITMPAFCMEESWSVLYYI